MAEVAARLEHEDGPVGELAVRTLSQLADKGDQLTSPKWLLASSMEIGLSELAGCTLSQLAENSDQHAITEVAARHGMKACPSEN